MELLDFKTAFKYPFNRPKGLLNILWVLLPIIGWFAFFGYSIRIVKNFLKNNFKATPIFSFSTDLKLGFFMFLKSLPFFIAYVAIIMLANFLNGLFGALANILLGIFILPILTINFYNKETVSSYFELDKTSHVFSNFLDYVLVFIKTIVLASIFLLMSLVLVGVPAGSYTKSIFLADFYRRNVK